MITAVDIRLKYKAETGLNPYAQYRKVDDVYGNDRRVFGGFPVSAYGIWLEEKISPIYSLKLKEEYIQKTGLKPTYKSIYLSKRYGGIGDGLKPEYILWMEEKYIKILENE